MEEEMEADPVETQRVVERDVILRHEALADELHEVQDQLVEVETAVPTGVAVAETAVSTVGTAGTTSETAKPHGNFGRLGAVQSSRSVWRWGY